METDNIVLPKEINFHALAEIESEFGRSPLMNISQAYTKNLDNVIRSLTLPKLLQMKATFARTQVAMAIGIAVGKSIVLLKSNSGSLDDLPTNVNKILTDPSEWDADFWEQEILKDPKKYLTLSKNDWQHALTYPTVKNGYDQLLLQTVAGTWTAFETLSIDLWEQAVNDNPLTLAKRAVSSKPDDSEFGKAVNWDKILSLDFEIKNRIGTLMKSKFKYSDPEKILKAYSSIGDEKSFSFLASESLILLAQLRHIILHNKGIADARFKAETRSELEVGTLYPVNENLIYQFINEVISTGRQLLREVSRKY
jgi:hypothetical protein